MTTRSTTNDVLVIIGVGGMGLSIARRIGAGRTIVLADVNAAALKTGADALGNDGHQVLTREVDVTSRSSVAVVAGWQTRPGVSRLLFIPPDFRRNRHPPRRSWRSTCWGSPLRSTSSVA